MMPVAPFHQVLLIKADAEVSLVETVAAVIVRFR